MKSCHSKTDQSHEIGGELVCVSEKQMPLSHRVTVSIYLPLKDIFVPAHTRLHSNL